MESCWEDGAHREGSEETLSHCHHSHLASFNMWHLSANMHVGACVDVCWAIALIGDAIVLLSMVPPSKPRLGGKWSSWNWTEPVATALIVFLHNPPIWSCHLHEASLFRALPLVWCQSISSPVMHSSSYDTGLYTSVISSPVTVHCMTAFYTSVIKFFPALSLFIVL